MFLCCSENIMISKAVILLILCIHIIFGQRKGDECILRNGRTGICRLSRECSEEEKAAARKGINPLCDFDGTRAVLCCSKSNPTVSTPISTTVSSVLNSSSGVVSNEGDECFHIKSNSSGVCTDVRQCKTALKEIEERLDPQRCRFDGTIPIVCCPQKKKKKEFRKPGQVSIKKCEEYSQYVWTKELNPILLKDAPQFIDRYECEIDKNVEMIVGGTKAGRREFPHMVSVGFDLGSGNIGWSCGGSLISDRYVLTAAHCLRQIHDNKIMVEAKYARMGITNITNYDHVQIYEVIERIQHPDYNHSSHIHDIALLKMNQSAELNTFVRPACLFTGSISPESNVIASGWGKTYDAGPESPVLLKVVLKLYNHKSCENAHRDKEIKNYAMICAGSPKQGTDTCQGDSGGPLQIYKDGDRNMSCMYDIVGLTSYGRSCGMNADEPAVYTRVSYYIKWIEDIVWPSSH